MKSATVPDAAWCAVVSTDPADLDRDAVADLLRSIASVRAVCDAAEVRAIRRTRKLNESGSAEPAEHLLANQTGRSSKHAREAAAREEACAAMPGLEAGLTTGSIGAGHVDAAAAVHAKLDDVVAEQFAAYADDLVARSQQVGVDAFDRECRDLARHLTALNNPSAEVDELERQKAASSVKRWVDRTTGMHNTLLSLDPIRDAKMWKVINHHVGRERQKRPAKGEARLPFAALQAEAFVNAVAKTTMPNSTGTSPGATNGPSSGADTPDSGAPRPGLARPSATNLRTPEPAASTAPAALTDTAQPTGPAQPTGTSQPTDSNRATVAPSGCLPSTAAIRLPEISILCDFDTLTTGIKAASGVCETDDAVALPPEAVRRLACDANVIPMVLGSNGEVLDQGRKVRTATAAQRNALAAMHATCAFPGCTVGFSATRMHHVLWWWEHLGPTDIQNLLPLCENDHHRVHEGGWGLTLDSDRIATWTRPDGTVHHQGSTIDRRPPDFPLRQ